MSKVKFVIIGVHERDDMIFEMKKKCPDADVFYDPIKNKKCLQRLLKVLKLYDLSDYTHICILQDDLELCNNFEEIVSIMCDQFPNVVFSPYNQRLNYDDKKTESPYINIRGCNCYGVMFIFNKNIIDDFERYVKENSLEDYNHDDEAVGNFCLDKDIKIYATIPSLVQHLGINKSTLGHNFFSQQSKVYNGIIAPSLENWYDKNVNDSKFMRCAKI